MYELAEKAYFFELERKDKLENGLALPLTVVFGGVALLGYSMLKLSAIDPVSPIGFFAGVALFEIVGAFSLFTFFAWHFSLYDDYAAIWLMDGTLEYRKKLRDYHIEIDEEDQADERFFNEMTMELARCTSQNARMNDKRGIDLYKCRANALFFALGTFTLAALSSTPDLVR